MATSQSNMIGGVFTLAPGPANLEAAFPAAAYPGCVAWATDRGPTPGYMVSNGVDWESGIGPPGLGTVTPVVSARALNTVFQPHATKATAVNYSIAQSVTNPLIAGASTSLVTLLSDASNPPVTERGRVAMSSSVALAVAIAITQQQTVPLGYIVPPGHYVRLVATTSGTASNAIASQVEETLG